MQLADFVLDATELSYTALSASPGHNIVVCNVILLSWIQRDVKTWLYQRVLALNVMQRDTTKSHDAINLWDPIRTLAPLYIIFKSVSSLFRFRLNSVLIVRSKLPPYTQEFPTPFHRLLAIILHSSHITQVSYSITINLIHNSIAPAKTSRWIVPTHVQNGKTSLASMTKAMWQPSATHLITPHQPATSPQRNQHLNIPTFHVQWV